MVIPGTSHGLEAIGPFLELAWLSAPCDVQSRVCVAREQTEASSVLLFADDGCSVAVRDALPEVQGPAGIVGEV